MGTLTLASIRNMVRYELNESSALSDLELNSIINDGYKDITVKTLCYENKIPVLNIPSCIKTVNISQNNIIRIVYVEYDLGNGCLGMKEVMPQTIGHLTIDGDYPQFWFQWGVSLVIEPLPTVSTYDINIYAACYPSVIMSLDGDLPICLPSAFHECIYLYAVSFAALKLKRWLGFVSRYNKYIASIQEKKKEFVSKYPDTRSKHDTPMSVEQTK
jgi:hypothetical protein